MIFLLGGSGDERAAICKVPGIFGAFFFCQPHLRGQDLGDISVFKPKEVPRAVSPKGQEMVSQPQVERTVFPQEEIVAEKPEVREEKSHRA